MIYGIGTDLVNSERVEKLLNKFGDKFLFKIFSNEEIKNSKKSYNKALYFSKRFAIYIFLVLDVTLYLSSIL